MKSELKIWNDKTLSLILYKYYNNKTNNLILRICVNAIFYFYNLQELELKEECSLIFECNQCESFYRSIGSYLSHKITFCSQNSSENFEEDLIHKVYSWPYADNFKDEMKKKEFDPLLLVCISLL